MSYRSYLSLLGLAVAWSWGLLACHGASSARSEAGPDGITIVRAPTGLLVVVNRAPVHLTLSLAGDELGVSEDDPAVWIVDGQIIQVAIVPRQAIYGGVATKVSDQQLLLDHLHWESAYVSKELGTPVTARPETCHTSRGTECMFFDYDVPDGTHVGGQTHANLHLTTVIADQVVALASPLQDGEDRVVVEARLRAVLDTFRPRAAWIDPAVVRASLDPRVSQR